MGLEVPFTAARALEGGEDVILNCVLTPGQDWPAKVRWSAADVPEKPATSDADQTLSLPQVFFFAFAAPNLQL